MSEPLPAVETQDNLASQPQSQTLLPVKADYRSLIGLHSAILMLSILLIGQHQMFKQSEETIMASEKILLLLYLTIECFALFFDQYLWATFISFSFLINIITAVVIGKYPISTIVIAFAILVPFTVVLILLANYLPLNVIWLMPYFILGCLFFCSLSMLNSLMFWSKSGPRLVGLALGSILFSFSIVMNCQVMMGKEGSTLWAPSLTLMRLVASLIYLLLTELAAITV